MIIKDYFASRADGVRLYRTYSDVGMSIKQIETGAIYSEAIDIEGAPYHYEEVESLDEITPEEALNIIVGGQK